MRLKRGIKNYIERRVEIGLKCVNGKLKSRKETKRKRGLKEAFAMKMRRAQWRQ
jgi:hypothetical protein